MNRFFLLFLSLFVAPLCFASEMGQARYIGGTTALKQSTLGKLDATSDSLNFQHSGGLLTIRFDRIETYEYSKPVARHLGVLPAIAVGLFKHRQRKHFVRIAYHDENNAPQVAVFEVPKQMPRVLIAVLQARGPLGSNAKASIECGRRDWLD